VVAGGDATLVLVDAGADSLSLCSGTLERNILSGLDLCIKQSQQNPRVLRTQAATNRSIASNRDICPHVSYSYFYSDISVQIATCVGDRLCTRLDGRRVRLLAPSFSLILVIVPRTRAGRMRIQIGVNARCVEISHAQKRAGCTFSPIPAQ
jgi:hypothetical protein